MATHTLVVEFDGDGPAYAAGDTILGGRLMAVNFSGDRLAVADELLEACLKLVEWDDREKDHAISFMARINLCEEAFTAMHAAIAKSTGGAA